MVEKFRGLIPPGSIWYRLGRDESLVLLGHQGMLDDMSPEQIEAVDSVDIQVAKGKVTDLEQILNDVGLEIITLYD
jgi:hypothetical protein